MARRSRQKDVRQFFLNDLRYIPFSLRRMGRDANAPPKCRVTFELEGGNKRSRDYFLRAGLACWCPTIRITF